MSHLTALNSAQKKAVTCIDGPLLVLAGAGAGKTRVITHRIVHLIETGISPQNILAVTFTNKAAKEMDERVMDLLRRQELITASAFGTRPTIATFHSLGVSLLRQYRERLGLKRQFIIFDRADSRAAIKQALTEAGYDPKQFEPSRILSLISRAKGEAMSLSVYQSGADSHLKQVAAKTWLYYENILKANDALDFDDLLTHTLSMLTSHNEIGDEVKNRFTHIHVDEYQDTNKVQYEIIRFLASETMNICVVGDIDQNIYSWRGADIKNVLQFEKHFPGAETVILEENYRSTKTIIAASNEVISKNNNRIEKTVFTNNQVGSPISVYIAKDERDEAEYIALEAGRLIKSGVAPEAIAVLFRTNWQSRVMERGFLDFGVPYQLLGTQFFERKEVKDILSYLRLLQNPDSQSDLVRIINMPPRGIGALTKSRVMAGQLNQLGPAALRSFNSFNNLISELRGAAETKNISALIKLIIEQSGYSDYLNKRGEDGLERLENLYELVTSATRYDDLSPSEGAEQLLSEAALHSDQDQLDNAITEGGVKLMTVHSAKGLEFPYVFVAGLEEDLFPHKKSNPDDLNDGEEERRLFYVALTRAEKKVYLTYALTRTIFGTRVINTPSSFLSDIDESCLELCQLKTEAESVIKID